MLIKTEVNVRDPAPTISASQTIPTGEGQHMLLTLAAPMLCCCCHPGFQTAQSSHASREFSPVSAYTVQELPPK